MTSDAVAQWDAVLTQMEDDLDRYEEQVRLDEITTVPRWEPPEGLPPLPESLAPRVKQLQERVKLLTTFVQYQMVATESDIAFASQQERKGQKGTHNKAVALFLDASV